MPDPLAFFLTWTTYGTWLPGDERGWVAPSKGIQQPDALRKSNALTRMRSSACKLNSAQRVTVDQTIADHCEFRDWEPLAINCRTNHVHVVVSADIHPKRVIAQLKAYCTRRLRAQQVLKQVQPRKDWWTEGGSTKYLNTEQSVEAAVNYVKFGQ
ncbi:MAG: transposase [Planctomycetota bacterium]